MNTLIMVIFLVLSAFTLVAGDHGRDRQEYYPLGAVADRLVL